MRATRVPEPLRHYALPECLLDLPQSMADKPTRALVRNRARHSLRTDPTRLTAYAKRSRRRILDSPCVASQADREPEWTCRLKNNCQFFSLNAHANGDDSGRVVLQARLPIVLSREATLYLTSHCSRSIARTISSASVHPRPSRIALRHSQRSVFARRNPRRASR
jgi:hypothetical protein